MQDGITIVEVYFEWAGHCIAMTRYLKKIRMEVKKDLKTEKIIIFQVGEDSGLQFAMANADLISALHPFRGSCKPAWLFMISGVNI